MSILQEPPILFFILGILAVFLKTGLEIPDGLSKFLSLYLLMSIGFKGGLSLAKTGLSNEFLLCLVGGVLLAILIPLILYLFLRRKLPLADSAAIAATYGSVSAVTFVAGTTWLESQNLDFSGSMIAILALMEAPAIMFALFIHSRDSGQGTRLSLPKLAHESLLNSSVYLLLGSVLIGVLTGPFGQDSIGTMMIDLFMGFLCFFMLDIGLKSGRTLKNMEMPTWLIAVALVVPLLGASLALLWGFSFGINTADTFLLMTLGAGASYIAVPAALRLTLPEAREGIYLTMALGVTFPFNILIGIPLYWWAAQNIL